MPDTQEDHHLPRTLLERLARHAWMDLPRTHTDIAVHLLHPHLPLVEIVVDIPVVVKWFDRCCRRSFSVQDH